MKEIKMLRFLEKKGKRKNDKQRKKKKIEK